MSRKQQTEEWKDKDGDKEEVLVNVGGRYPADTWEEYGLKQLCHFSENACRHGGGSCSKGFIAWSRCTMYTYL